MEPYSKLLATGIDVRWTEELQQWSAFGTQYWIDPGYGSVL